MGGRLLLSLGRILQKVGFLILNDGVGGSLHLLLLNPPIQIWRNHNSNAAPLSSSARLALTRLQLPSYYQP